MPRRHDRRRLSDALRDRIRRLRRAEPAAAPTLTVVVPVYNVVSLVGECLDSLLGQSLRDLEVIAIDDGSTDGSLDVLREYAARDPRLRVLTQTNSGQGIARNVGVGLASGEFLTFCDADDVVPKQAYAHMVATLQDTGSDFCVGATRRFSHQRSFGMSWRGVHDRDVLGTTIDQSPAAMQDIIACNRMFRTAFWRERVPPFRGHIAYEDHVPMLAAYVRATRFDLLARVTYRWRIREDNTSTGQQKASIENLLDRIAVKEEAWELMLAEATPVAYDAWVARTIDVDFQPFIEPALASGDMYRNVLSAAFATMLGRANGAALDQVRYRAKVRAWLCASGEWDTIVEADLHFQADGHLPATRIEDGRLVAVPDPDAAYLELVPQSMWGLATQESDLVGGLQHASWHPDGTLSLVGFAFVRGLTTPKPHDIQAWFHHEATGADLPVEVRPLPDSAANAAAGTPRADYGASGLEIVVPAQSVVAASDSLPAVWSLRLRISQDGLVREGGLHEVVAGSSAARLRARVVPDPDGGALLVTPAADDRGMELSVDRIAVTVQPGELRTGVATGRVLDGSVQAIVVERLPSRERFEVAVTEDGGFEVPLPDGTGPVVRRLRLLARLSASEVVPAFPPSDWSPALTAGSTGPTWLQDGSGRLEVAVDPRRAAVSDVRLTDEHIVVELDGAEIAVDAVRTATLACDGVTLTADVQAHEHGAALLFPRRVDRWGTGIPVVPPPDQLTLAVTLTDGSRLVGEPGTALEPQLPAVRLDQELRLNLGRRRNGRLGITVAVPLSETESTRYGQRVLRDAYVHASGPAPGVPLESVLFCSFSGRRVDGDPLAIDRELARSRPDLVRYWGIRSFATPVPDGAVPVLVESEAWYDVLRSASFLCVDDDLDPSFRKRSHQQVLQTFRGRPSKSMGRALWRHQGLSEERIAAEAGRRGRTWDAVLAPDEDAADAYRREFDFAGRVLIGGTPHCDALVGADRDAVRRRVLEGLGVPLDATVVLYAPTYRDAFSRRVATAGLSPHLDLAALATGLGPGHVILLRAHPYDRRDAARAAVDTGVVDVTDHPDLSGLLHAADAAVLDYSSLRFDWALTGRPAVCFVPELERYTDVRPLSGDYAPTAPGPLATTTAEVTALLGDLPDLARRCGPDLVRVNGSFNAAEDGRAAERVVREFFGG